MKVVDILYKSTHRSELKFFLTMFMPNEVRVIVVDVDLLLLVDCLFTVFDTSLMCTFGEMTILPLVGKLFIPLVIVNEPRDFMYGCSNIHECYAEVGIEGVQG